MLTGLYIILPARLLVRNNLFNVSCGCAVGYTDGYAGLITVSCFLGRYLKYGSKENRTIANGGNI